MKRSVMLTIGAVYMGIIGLMFALAPQLIAMDAMPANPSPDLMAFLRVPAGGFIGIAVLDWFARKAEASTAMNAVLLSNIVGFSVTTVLNVWALMNGRQIALMFGTIHLLFTIGFILARRRD